MPNKRSGRANPLPKQKQPLSVVPAQIQRPGPQTKVYALVFTGKVFADHVVESFKLTLAQGIPIVVYPIAPEYSLNMRPVAFGKALAFIPNEHGQVAIGIYTQFHRDDEVTFEAQGLVRGDWAQEFNEAWKLVYDAVWEPDPESV